MLLPWVCVYIPGDFPLVNCSVIYSECFVYIKRLLLKCLLHVCPALPSMELTAPCKKFLRWSPLGFVPVSSLHHFKDGSLFRTGLRKPIPHQRQQQIPFPHQLPLCPHQHSSIVQLHTRALQQHLRSVSSSYTFFAPTTSAKLVGWRAAFPLNFFSRPCGTVTRQAVCKHQNLKMGHRQSDH